MKKITLIVVAIVMAIVALAQEYNQNLLVLGQYVKRMYLEEPFTGVRVIEDADNCYLVSIVVDPAGRSDAATLRKVQVKGLSYANEFLNGTFVDQKTIIHTKGNSRGYSNEEIEDFIEARSMGYVQSMQTISTFTDDSNAKVYVYCKQMPMPRPTKKKRNK